MNIIMEIYLRYHRRISIVPFAVFASLLFLLELCIHILHPYGKPKKFLFNLRMEYIIAKTYRKVIEEGST